MRRLLRRLLDRGASNPGGETPASLAVISPDLPIPYSWVLTNSLAIGPMPTSLAHWQQLEDAGLRSRFSCCYPSEEGPAPVPEHWRSDTVPLPDHRRQERLDVEQLAVVLDQAQQLLHQSPPLYLHCLAGIERSPLIAVGLTARERRLSLFEALDWVRRCHPAALPIYAHLELLERVLSGAAPTLISVASAATAPVPWPAQPAAAPAEGQAASQATAAPSPEAPPWRAEPPAPPSAGPSAGLSAGLSEPVERPVPFTRVVPIAADDTAAVAEASGPSPLPPPGDRADPLAGERQSA